MSIFRRPLDLGLVALFVVSAALVLVAHEGPFAKVIYDLAIASMVSLIFYGLVVRLPDYQRRRRIKRINGSRKTASGHAPGRRRQL